jgi:hypothetical protein
MNDKNCISLLRKCECGYYFGKKKEIKICPHCNNERKRCSKPRSFKWVKDPESGRYINTGFRYDTCNYHSNREPIMLSGQEKTKENFDLSDHGHQKTDEEIQENFLEKHVDTDSPTFLVDARTATGFVPKVDKDSELFNVWSDEIDNPKIYDLRGELALLRTYLQFTVASHGDYPEATDIRLAQKLMEQITNAITNLMELEIKLKLLVDVSDVKMMIEKVIGVILESNISPQEKIKLAEEIQKVTSE